MGRIASSPIRQLIHRVFADPRMPCCADQELLQRFLGQRDEAAFEALVRRHGPMVLDVCRGVLAQRDGRGRRLPGDVPHPGPEGRLPFATRRPSRAGCTGSPTEPRARRARTSPAQEARGPRSPPATGRDQDAADDLTWREVRQVVHEELNALSERYRAPLVLCYLEGRTQDEAAALLGLAKSTLQSRLERGRACLRARLRARGLGPAALLVAVAWPADGVSASVPPTLVAATVTAANLVAAGPTAVRRPSRPRSPRWRKECSRACCSRESRSPWLGPCCSRQSPASASASWPSPYWARGRRNPPSRRRRLERPAREALPAKARAASAEARKAIRCLRMRSAGLAPFACATAHVSRRSLSLPTASGSPAAVRTGGSPSGTSSPASSCGISPAWAAGSAPSPFRRTAISWRRPAARQSPVIVLWNAATGAKLHQLKGHQKDIDTLAFSPDGKLLASGGADRTVHFWDPTTGKQRGITAVQSGAVHQVAFSPDGKWLAVGAAGQAAARLGREDGQAGAVDARRALSRRGLFPRRQAVGLQRRGNRALGRRHGSAGSHHPRSLARRAVAGLHARRPDVGRWGRRRRHPSLRGRDGQRAPAVPGTHGPAPRRRRLAPSGKIIASAGNDNCVHLADTATGRSSCPRRATRTR